MASTYVNAFDLLGDDESDDVTVLLNRLNKKTLEEVPSSPRKTRKEYVVFAENSDHVEYEAEDVNGNGNGNGNGVINTTNLEQDISNRDGDDVVENGTWQTVSKKVVVNQVQRNNYRQRPYRNYGRGGGNRGRRFQRANADGSDPSKGDGHVNGERPRSRKRNDRGDGEYSGRGRGKSGTRRVDDGEVKKADNVCDGDGQTIANSEGDAAAVTVDSSIVEEVNGDVPKPEETEEDNGGVPKPEETAEERKEREREEQFRKEKEERRRIREQEEAEEAKKMTLAQYEKIRMEKKQALNIQKSEVPRVVAADLDLENMKLVSKKQEKDEVLIVKKEKPKDKAGLEKPTSEGKLQKSESIEKKGRKPVAVGLSELFRPASFRGSNGGGRGRGTGRPNQGGLGRRFTSGDSLNNDRPQINNGPSSAMTRASLQRPTKIPAITDNHQFPVLGTAPEPAVESSAPTADLSASNRSSSGPSSSHSGSRGNRSGSGPNRSYAGNRSSAPAANRTSAATRSAPAAKSSARAEH